MKSNDKEIVDNTNKIDSTSMKSKKKVKKEIKDGILSENSLMEDFDKLADLL